MLQTLRQTSRRVLVVVVLTALLSLLHTINHDALIGSHHDDGDHAASTIQLVLTVATALLGTVAIIGGTVLVKRMQGAGPLLTLASSAVDPQRIRPTARAGPTIPLLLSAVRR